MPSLAKDALWTREPLEVDPFQLSNRLGQSFVPAATGELTSELILTYLPQRECTHVPLRDM